MLEQLFCFQMREMSNLGYQGEKPLLYQLQVLFCAHAAGAPPLAPRGATLSQLLRSCTLRESLVNLCQGCSTCTKLHKPQHC